MKLFSSSNIEIVKSCQEFFGFKLPSTLLSKHIAKFESMYHNPWLVTVLIMNSFTLLPCRNPLADLKNFASKRAPAYPLSIGLHLMTLRQKQKVAVLFTKISTLTSNNVQPPAAGTSPWTERPPKRRILLGAQDVRYIPCEFGVDRPTRFRDMDYAIFTHWPQCKNSTPPPAPGADHPRTILFPFLLFALPWAKISRRSHHPALRYPQPYKKKQQT